MRDFFTEHALTPEVSQINSFEQWQCPGIKLLQGDFFDLSADMVAQVAYVFDRAALIALDSAQRQVYAQHLCKVLPNTASILLITLEYPTDQMDGPPFSVSSMEVLHLFEPRFTVQVLEQQNVLDEHPRFQARGLEYLMESTYLLTPRQSPAERTA